MRRRIRSCACSLLTADWFAGVAVHVARLRALLRAGRRRGAGGVLRGVLAVDHVAGRWRWHGHG
jgi:hypothetical protein